MISKELLAILACPVCKGKLDERDDDQRLICRDCEILFTVREGIPVMLSNKAATQLK